MRTLKLLSLFMLLSACSNEAEPVNDTVLEEEPSTITITDAQRKNAGIETGIISKQEIQNTLQVNGVAEAPPQNLVSVSFPLGGYISSTKMVEGMQVKKGQVLAIIEDPSIIKLQQDYLTARTQLTLNEQEFERQKMLYENNVNANKVFQQAAAQLQTQQITLKALEESLKLIGLSPSHLNAGNISKSVPVYSPISGYVSKVNINMGKYIMPTDVLFELINPSDVRAVFTVFEKDLHLIKKGQQVKVSFANNNEFHLADVVFVTRNVDNDRRALVHCDFKKLPDFILPGMYIKGIIEVNNYTATTLAEDAVVRYGDGEFIFIETSVNTFKLTEINTGNRNAAIVELLNSEALEGQTVITKNPYPLLGMLKNIEED